MPNQSKNDRSDRNGGGDVTKASKVNTPDTPKTKWDQLNAHGPGRFDPQGE